MNVKLPMANVLTLVLTQMDHFTAHVMMVIASATMTIKAVMVGKNNMKKGLLLLSVHCNRR